MSMLEDLNREIDQFRAENERMKKLVCDAPKFFDPRYDFDGEKTAWIQTAFPPPAPQSEEVTVTRWFGVFEDGSLSSQYNTEEEARQWVVTDKFVELTGTYQRPIPVKTKRRAEIPADSVSHPNGGRYVEGTKFYREWEE